MEVSIGIPNARRVSLHLSVWSSFGLFASSMLLTDSTEPDSDPISSRWLHTNYVQREMQSFAVVHVQQTHAERAQELLDRQQTAANNTVAGVRPSTRRGYNAIGQRQRGDRLLHFRSLNVTNLSKFAERDFQYSGDGEQVISYVGFAFDVSNLCA